MPKPSKQHRCDGCQFWNQWQTGGAKSSSVMGDCRKHAPVPGYREGKLQAFFPPQTGDSYCHEFEPNTVDSKRPKQVPGIDGNLFTPDTMGRIKDGRK